MKIRTKIALYFGPFILIVISAIFLLNYYLVRNSLAENAQAELAKIHRDMYRASQTILSTAIRNYLRGITEKNLDYIRTQYIAVADGRLAEAKAKERIQNHFNSQLVGNSGYLVAVEERDERLFLDLHPFLAKQDCTDTEGCRAWAATRNGYTEYDWKNPLDNSFRKKAAYIQEFPAWNWIVGASSYRDEFINLVKIEDLRKLLSPIRINDTGYFLVFNENGTVLIHPEYQNKDGSQLTNSKGQNILELLKKSKDGYVTYLWKNPSEAKERLKYAIVDKLEGYNWYLVATGYLSEVYKPIEFLKDLTIFMILVTISVLFAIIYRVSRNITEPLSTLKQAIDRFYEEKLQFRWDSHPIEEINVLGSAFSQMTKELDTSLTELKEKNTALAVSERLNEENSLYLHSIINSMPSAIICVAPDLAVTQWNAAAKSLTGSSLDEAHDSGLYDVFSSLEPYAEKIRESLSANEVKSFSHQEPDSTGKYRYYEITIFPLISESNKGAVIRVDDITDRVEMDLRLHHSQKMDAVGQLAGGIAHDFNNMLSGIIGAAELLRTKVKPEEQRLVKIISEASGRTAELIQKLLSFSRKEIVAYAPINVHTVITNTCDILKRSLDKRIHMDTRLQAKPSMVNGDWSQLQSCFLNIGINSGHAMPDGGRLAFSTTTAEIDEFSGQVGAAELNPGNYLVIEIQDTGCGIAEEHLAHIFEPFFTTRKQSEGTGLGLAAVYGAVQQHGGAIEVESGVGKGTCFRIYLPLIEAEEPDSGKEDQLKTGEGCILIVDDEPVVRETAKMMLESLGYSTLVAEDGRRGVEVYKRHGEIIDLVLLDMVMPVMDGTECFHQLKKINPLVKVIIASGFTRDANLSKLKLMGLLDFIRKPFSLEQISQALAQAMHTEQLKQ